MNVIHTCTRHAAQELPWRLSNSCRLQIALTQWVSTRPHLFSCWYGSCETLTCLQIWPVDREKVIVSKKQKIRKKCTDTTINHCPAYLHEWSVFSYRVTYTKCNYPFDASVRLSVTTPSPTRQQRIISQVSTDCWYRQQWWQWPEDEVLQQEILPVVPPSHSIDFDSDFDSDKDHNGWKLNSRPLSFVPNKQLQNLCSHRWPTHSWQQSN